MKRLSVILLLALAVVSCEKKEFPVEVVEPSIFKVQGSFDGQLLSFEPDGQGTFMFTEVEQHGEEAFELITEFRNPDCDDCEEMLRFTWLLGVEEDEIAEELGEGEVEFFETFEDGQFGYEIDLEGFEDFDFQVWEVNGEEVGPDVPDFITADDEGMIDVGVWLTDDFGNCDQYIFYSLGVNDICGPSDCLVYFEYEVEDDVLTLIPIGGAGDMPLFWEIDGMEVIVPGDTPVEWPIVDDGPIDVAVTPLGPFECNFSWFSRNVFLDEDTDCEVPSFYLEPEYDFEDISLLIEYVDENGIYYSSAITCDSWWIDEFEQPENSFFDITNAESYQANQDGLPTRKLDFIADFVLIPDNPLADELIVEDFVGTIAVALPD